ncbi:unnamed protein product [[Candida] boidinii]|nr:unnamed protein product [[Candida] boidinii]
MDTESIASSPNTISNANFQSNINNNKFSHIVNNNNNSNANSNITDTDHSITPSRTKIIENSNSPYSDQLKINSSSSSVLPSTTTTTIPTTLNTKNNDFKNRLRRLLPQKTNNNNKSATSLYSSSLDENLNSTPSSPIIQNSIDIMPVFRFPSFRSSSNNSNSALKTDSNLNSFDSSSFVNGNMKINNTTDQIRNHSNGNQDENDDDEDDEDEDDEDDKDDDENINHINSIGTRKNPNIFFKKVLSRKNLTPQLKAFKRIASELQNETRPLEYEIQHENAITKIIKDEDEILSSPIASNLLNSKLYSPDEDNLKKYEIITKANEQWNNHNHNQNQQNHQNHQSQQIRLQNSNPTE